MAQAIFPIRAIRVSRIAVRKRNSDGATRTPGDDSAAILASAVRIANTVAASSISTATTAVTGAKIGARERSYSFPAFRRFLFSLRLFPIFSFLFLFFISRFLFSRF